DTIACGAESPLAWVAAPAGTGPLRLRGGRRAEICDRPQDCATHPLTIFRADRLIFNQERLRGLRQRALLDTRHRLTTRAFYRKSWLGMDPANEFAARPAPPPLVGPDTETQ